jgi:hypothetical protein
MEFHHSFLGPIEQKFVDGVLLFLPNKVVDLKNKSF